MAKHPRDDRSGTNSLNREDMMVKTIKALGCCCAWVILSGLWAVSAAAGPSDWKAGVAQVDTTPGAPVWMSGYASRSSPSQGVAHPLAAKALALADRQGNRIVLISCDIIGFNRAFTGRVTDRVKAKYGLPRENIVLLASHCHSGPTLIDSLDRLSAGGVVRDKAQNNLDYTRDLENKLVDLVGVALGKMEPVTLSYGIGRAHFALNRREKTDKGIRLGKNPAGPTDESVPILRVQAASGKPLAIVFGYACHNTTHRPDMMCIDPDYAGHAQDRIEEEYPGATALFVTGCAGDADPHPYGTLDLAKQHGRELGEAVKFALDRPAMMTPLSGSLRAAFTETTIHFGGPTDRASYEKLLNDPNTGRKRHAQRMIEAIDQKKPIRTAYPYAAQAFALGDQLTLLTLSGEVVVDYAIRLQKELGAEGRSLWVAAYANDVVGYIPSVRVLNEGGYEAGEAFFVSTFPAPLAEDIESIVVKAAHEMVEKVRGK
jgi:neutral ceramidase